MTDYEISLQSAIMADPNLSNNDVCRVYGKDIFVDDDEVIYYGYAPVKLKKEVAIMQEDGTVVMEWKEVAAYEPSEDELTEEERAERVTHINANSTVVVTPVPECIEKNKYNTGNSSSIEVKITPSVDMKALCPNTLVSIDGKYYELNILGEDKPIVFSMDRDHRISINWVHNDVVETFRFICKR